MDLRQIILDHNARYPAWQLEDLVKLIFQNEFGNGHFVSDEKTSLQRLQAELASITQKHGSLFERIGNGYVRLNLPALADQLTPETVNRIFVTSANTEKGQKERFEAKLKLARGLCLQGELPFAVAALDAYLQEYKQAGFPPVSHSQAYRNTYLPSYRVISELFAHYFPLFQQIEENLLTKDLFVVAIDGPAASGKSTLARLLQQVFNSSVIATDHFFLRPEQRTAKRFAEPGANLDYERFQLEVLPYLRGQAEFSYEIYDCQTQTFSQSKPIKPRGLVVVEGCYSHHPVFQESYDLKVFLTIDSKVQLERIEKRNGPAMLERFSEEWIPLENRYFAHFEVEKGSDLVFSEYPFPLRAEW